MTSRVKSKQRERETEAWKELTEGWRCADPSGTGSQEECETAGTS